MHSNIVTVSNSKMFAPCFRRDLALLAPGQGSGSEQTGLIVVLIPKMVFLQNFRKKSFKFELL